MVERVIGYFSKKFSVLESSSFKNSLRTTRRKLKISLAISFCIFLFLLFRILIYHAGFGAKLGQQIYLTAPKNVPIERTIDIVMAFDDTYAQHSAAAMASILLNCDASSRFRFHILDGGISSDKKEKLLKLKKLRDFEITFYDMTKYDWSIFPDNHIHTSEAAYYRLRIPEILPRNITKVLYLDGDIIVEQDLKELWNIDLSNSALGAVEDANGINLGMRLGVSKKYFNSGVLLLNLEKFRQANSTKKIVKYVENNRKQISYHDQDILNGMFNDQYKEIPLKWNAGHSMYVPDRRLKHTYTDDDALIARKNPGIIHFTENKPWYWGWIPHPLEDEYWKYLKYTEFYSCAKRDFALSKVMPVYITRVRSYFNQLINELKCHLSTESKFSGKAVKKLELS